MIQSAFPIFKAPRVPSNELQPLKAGTACGDSTLVPGIQSFTHLARVCQVNIANVIGRPEFEITYYNVTIQHAVHYATLAQSAGAVEYTDFTSAEA